MKILLVEDEELLSNVIAKGLKKLKFAVDQAFDGEEALSCYEINSYDMMILDLNIPVLDGMEVLRQIRKDDIHTKIIILSARIDIDDRVSGLNQGANDYLIKPFDFEELVARINNLMRRTFEQTSPVLTAGNITIDLLAKSVALENVSISLTNKEYGILEYLMINQDKVISQSELIEHIWDSDADLFSNALKFQLHSLKKKLGKIAAYYLAGRAMKPISKLNDEIKTINAENLSKRISVSLTKDEIENLSRSFNKLLERLERDFEKEKRFSANAAHELKTPITTIMTGAQVLKMSEQTFLEEYSEYLDLTLQSVKRLSSVVDGLLMLGGTSLDCSFETIQLSQMMEEIRAEIEPLHSEKNIALNYDLKIDCLTGNYILLYRAFFNLIENAYKYTEENGSITISSCCMENKTIVYIYDTGIGISKDDIQNIFEPFYRADKSRSRKIAGAGLGLSITKEIFALHEDAIAVESKKGAGTTIEVRFKS